MSQEGIKKIGKAVVIGGSGFMGSHTADQLSEHGYSVTIFDQRQSAWLRDDQKMVVGDILDRELLTSVIKDARYVYHFAGIADIGESSKRPYDTLHVNIMGTVSALEACTKASVDRFIYASTMYVYSSKGSFYRVSKQASEQIIETYFDKFDLKYTLLRYGSLYGPRSQDWNGLRGYVEQIVKTGKLNYRGTGTEKREYIHAHDAARLSVQVLNDIYINKAITVTGQQVLTSSELIDMIFEIAGIQKQVTMLPASLDNEHYIIAPYQYTPKKAKKLVPQEFVDIGQGILDMVEEIHFDKE